MDVFADKLANDHNYVQAGLCIANFITILSYIILVYSTSKHFDKAISTYKRCGHWRKCLYTAHEAKYTPEQILHLASEVITYYLK